MRVVVDMLNCVAGLSKPHMGTVICVCATKVLCRFGYVHSTLVGGVVLNSSVLGHMNVRMLLSVGSVQFLSCGYIFGCLL